MFKNRYKELVFTNHSLQRLKERKISMSQAWAVWRRPNKRTYAATKGGWVYQRNWGELQIEVVAKQNEKKEWVVLSVWSNRISRMRSRPLWIRGLHWWWKKIKEGFYYEIRDKR
jgi:hypothetical protein